jgi:cytoskeletal protein CcmA (bactofilin family)
MAVLLLAGLSFLTISSTERMIAMNERYGAQASLLAEAAIHRAIAQLNADSSYSGETNLTLIPSNSGTVNITVSASGQSCGVGKDLVATASIPVAGGTAQAEVRASVDKIAYPFRWALYSTVGDGVMRWDDTVGAYRGNAEVWLKSGVLVESFDSAGGAYSSTANHGLRGDIGSNSDVTIDGVTQVRGNLTAGDDIILTSASVTVTGLQTTHASTAAFPALGPPGSPCCNLHVAAGGTQTLSEGTYNYQDLTLDDGASLLTSGPVTLYVSGNSWIGDNVTIGANPGTNLRIITKSQGDDYSTSTWRSGTGLRLYASVYGRNTDVYLWNNSQVYGSIVARTVYVESGSFIRYDRAIAEQAVCRNGRYSIRRGTWREIRPVS